MDILLELKHHVVIWFPRILIMHFKHRMFDWGILLCHHFVIAFWKQKKTLSIFYWIKRSVQFLSVNMQGNEPELFETELCQCCQNQCSTSKYRQWNVEQKAHSNTFFSWRVCSFQARLNPMLSTKSTWEKMKDIFKNKACLSKNILE